MSEGSELNSLNRFRKRSDRLVLEQHSHCEVPAGCGGVVFRWRNPRATVPVTLVLHSPGRPLASVDGKAVSTGRLDLAPGPHLLAVLLEDVPLSAGLVLFVARAGWPEADGVQTSGPAEPSWKYLSQADGTWRASLSDPGTEAWRQLPFPDQDWLTLVEVSGPPPGPQDAGWYGPERCQEQGARYLGLPHRPAREDPPGWWRNLLGRSAGAAGDRGSVWVRKAFDVPPLP